MSGHVHDVAGVGLGPFNLGLAALLDRVPQLDGVFFEAKPDIAWHPGLMVPGAALQVPHLADLVTLADPTSPHSFLNYLHHHERLYRFYFHKRTHPTRREFQAYMRWVAANLDSTRFGAHVEEVRAGRGRAGQGHWEVAIAGGGAHRARAVVLGVGGVPVVPECATPLLGEDVLHASDYLRHRDGVLNADAVTVIGSGQSAAEVFADLLDHAPAGTRLDWFTRSPGFFPMEYSKLGLELFSPEYTAYFHGLPAARRDALREGQDLLYKGISVETSARIYDALYDRSIDGADANVTYAAGCELVGLSRDADGLRLSLVHAEQGARFAHRTGRVVLATGYESAAPPVAGLDALALRDERGHLKVDLDGRVALSDPDAGALFVQNAQLGSHGVGTPDLGLAAHRNARIVNALAGTEVYAVRERNVFQTFGAPVSARVEAGR